MITRDEADRINTAATQVVTTRREHYAATRAAQLLESSSFPPSELREELRKFLALLERQHLDAVEQFRVTLSELTEKGAD